MMTAFAVGPFAVAIFVGLGVALALDELDKRYHLTDRLVAKMEEITDEVLGEIARQWWEVERYLKWQALNGMPVGQGVFY